MAGALRYEFELATSRRFSGSSIVWTNVGDELEEPATTADDDARHHHRRRDDHPGHADHHGHPEGDRHLRTPTIAIDLALPWITGSPYALYAHVRAITKAGPTPWGKPFGFNIRWATIPRDLDSPYPGLVRWSPVEGATSYQVWLHGAKSTFETTTNVADARELYTFHATPQWTSTISFRVRAKRTVYGEVASGLETTTYGPWSPLYTDVQPPLSVGTLANLATVADTVNTTGSGSAHGLTPGFAFGGDRGGPMDYAFAQPAELYRVYVATDRDCVNIVFRSTIVGSPAYAPRLSGPLALPQTDQDVAKARSKALDFGGEGADLHARRDARCGDRVRRGLERNGLELGLRHELRLAATPTTPGTAPKIDLPDTAWPTGGYYWTVVPVHIVLKPPDSPPPGEPRSRPRDPDRVSRVGAAAGRLPVRPRPPLRQDEPAGRDRRRSDPSPAASRPRAGSSRPLVPRPSFYGTPLVAWQPALGAHEYEVQWSRTRQPVQAGGEPQDAARRRRCCRSRRARGTTASGASTRCCRSSPSSPGRRR